MNKSKIAAKSNASKTYVTLLLSGKRNPHTEKAMNIILEAANLYAEKCKEEYMSTIFKKWNLRQTIKAKKKKNSLELKQKNYLKV